MKRKLLSSISYLFVACTLAAHPAFAGTNLEEGIKLYNERRYAQARPLLEKAVAEAPNSWQAHYYLANTALGLGQTTRAKYHYEIVQKKCTNAAILEHCRAGLARADKHAVPKAAASAPEAQPEGDGKTDESAESKPLSDADKLKEKNREHIMKLAKEDCERVKKEKNDQLEHEAAFSGQRWRNRETGERRFGISQDRQSEIERECEEKCRRIMDDAKRRAAAIR